jgi:predicted membrane metal-binding protein
MRRRTFDFLASGVGVLLAIVLLVAGALLRAIAGTAGLAALLALIASIIAFVAGAILLILSGLGFWHLRRTPAETELVGVGAKS